MKELIALSIIIIVTVLCTNATSKSCHELVTRPVFQQAYVGWPHLVSFDLFLDTEPYTLFDIDEYAAVECIISDGIGEVVFNESTTVSELIFGSVNNFGHLISNVSSSSLLNYTLTISGADVGRCYSTRISLNVTQLPQLSCQEFVARSMRAESPQEIGSSQISRLSCQLDQNEYPKIGDIEDVKYQWQQNCENAPVNNSVADGKELFIRWKSYDQVGSYVCSATYNGMTRYIIARRFCIRKSLTLGTPPSLTCSKLNLLKNPGENAQFVCLANFGEGGLGRENFNINWKRQNESSKPIQCFSTNETKSGGVSCLYDNPNDICYNHVPRSDEVKQEAIVTIQLTIKNIRDNDYGSYALIAVKDGKNSANVTLTLAPNPIPNIQSQEITIGICIGATLLFILVMLVMLYNAVYIRVYWKRYFGVYIIDDRLYGATLAYNFSRESDSFSQQCLKRSVMQVRHVLEQRGYRVYDERRDGWFESEQSENITASIACCHRLVIFLSMDFIKDGWSMLALQKGFQEMINTRSKLIFVLLPGIKEYLKQHSKDDDSCQLIQRAIKINYAIQWSKSDLKKRRFLLQLEDAMPKLTSSSEKFLRSVYRYTISDAETNISTISQRDSCLHKNSDIL